MDDNLIAKIQREIDLGYGDSRLRFILNWVKSGRPLFECDKRYLARHLAHYAENETKHYEKFDEPMTTRLEHHVKRMEESMEENDTSRASQGQMPLISDAPESDDAAIRQVKVIVEMRKDLHHILVRLDQLEEKFREEARREEPKYEMVHRKRPSYLYDTPPERRSTIFERPREKPREKKEEAPQSIKEIPKNKPGLATFVTVLFVVTIVTIGALFVVMMAFANPAVTEKLQGYGITYDQVKHMLNWLVPLLIMYLGAWATFGLLYLQSIKKANKRG